jgi:ABC-type metal ion transport system substrate-binding protein
MALQESVSRGAFIVIEGLDRSGKTTQVKRLEAELSKSGKKVKVLRFPGNPCPDTCSSPGAVDVNAFQIRSDHAHWSDDQ